jgi:hypothetical protein
MLKFKLGQFQHVKKRFFKVVSTFVPWLRKMSIFQKKIKQFNVEFAVATVADQNRDTPAFSDIDFSAKLNAI